MLALNCTALMHCNLLTDIEIAKKVGFDGIEIIHQKLYRYLDEGCSIENLINALQDMPVVGVGALWDIDRQGQDFYCVLEETEKMSHIAKQLGSKMIQACPGPVDIQVVIDYKAGRLKENDIRYKGFLGKSWEEIRKGTAKNVRAISEIAKKNGQEVYLEPLGWAPFCNIKQALEIIDEAGSDNVGIIVDLWHAYVAGDKPEDIAKLDKKIIKGVHICDSLRYTKGVPDQVILRNVFTGLGVIPLVEWIQAIKSTGYDGWYSCEMFSRKHHEFNPVDVASTLLNIMKFLVK